MLRRVIIIHLLGGSLMGMAFALSCATSSLEHLPRSPDNFGGIGSFAVAANVDPAAANLGVSAEEIARHIDALLRNGGISFTEARPHLAASKAIIFLTVHSRTDETGLIVAVVICRLMRPLKTYDGRWAFGSVYLDEEIVLAISEDLERKVMLVSMLEAQKLARIIASRQEGRDA